MVTNDEVVNGEAVKGEVVGDETIESESIEREIAVDDITEGVTIADETWSWVGQEVGMSPP